VTFFRNSKLEHMHLISKLDQSVTSEEMRQMIRNMMMCLLRNYEVGKHKLINIRNEFSRIQPSDQSVIHLYFCI